MKFADFGLIEWVFLSSNLLLGLLGSFFLIWLYWYSFHDKNKLSKIEKHCENLNKLLNGSKSFMQLDDANLIEAKWNRENLDLVSNVLQGLSREEIRKLTEDVNKYGELIVEMNEVEPADFSNWKRSKQAKINSAMQSVTNVQKNSESIQEKLKNANSMIHSVKSRATSTDSTETWLNDNGVIREKLDNNVIQYQIQHAQTEAELKAIKRSEARLRKELTLEQERFDSFKALTKQNEQLLSNELAVSRSKYDELKNKFDQILLEKTFIEKAYMQESNQ
ncbi:hypothetical protein [Methylomonas sp. AM2-LC]|uniref:hypothetical protein n=1 Tax=Methylomonas sp. AM2-LC TaxID=3153301 RepID=UPI0032670F1B